MHRIGEEEEERSVGDRTALLDERSASLDDAQPPSCMGHVVSAVGTVLSTTLRYSRMPADALLNCLWHWTGSTNASAAGLSDDDHTTTAIATPARGSPPQGTSPSVDASNSPLYTSFHPGKGYETVSVDGGAAGHSHHGQATTTSRSQPLSFPPTDAARRLEMGVGRDPGSSSVDVVDVADHSPIYTAQELRRRILAVAPWLPVTVRVEATSAPGEGSAAGVHEVQALSVIISGPIRRPQRVPSMRSASVDHLPPPSLSDVEDYILEDTDPSMLVAAVQLMDLTFTAMEYGRPTEATRSASLHGSPSALRFDDDEEEPLEVQKARVVGMYQNLVNAVVERRGQPWGLRLAFVRCSMAPMDLLDSLRLPAAGFVECLTFEKCPLADAHVAALLRRARQDEHLFGHLRSLRLSGTLSPDAVRALLRYIDEEVEQPVLSELVVPNSCMGVALGHSVSVRLPHLLVNGKSIQRTEAPHHQQQQRQQHA